MEFASEMVVKATLPAEHVTEVPTTLSPDGRSRPPHLRTWRDGWRHLRFFLLYSPRWLFFFPDWCCCCCGVIRGHRASTVEHRRGASTSTRWSPPRRWS